MTSRLKNILALIALVLVFASCSKDADLCAPAEEPEPKGTTKQYEESATPPTTDTTGNGISDDDDDENDDDDGAAKSGAEVKN